MHVKLTLKVAFELGLPLPALLTPQLMTVIMRLVVETREVLSRKAVPRYLKSLNLVLRHLRLRGTKTPLELTAPPPISVLPIRQTCLPRSLSKNGDVKHMDPTQTSSIP